MVNKTARGTSAVFFLILLAVPAVLPSSLSAAAAFDSLFLSAPASCLSPRLPEAAPASPANEILPAGVFDVPAEKIYYLLPSQVDMSQVPPAPAAGSAVDNEDMAAVRRWQVERTEAQCAAANAQANATYDEFFGAVSPFGNPAPAEVEKIFSKVRTDTGSIDYVVKNKYKRPRPFLRDSSLNPCLGRESGYAYPSGHATTSQVFGLMLADLVPANAGKYKAYADQGGLNRVIGGVHHPSDTEAGRTLGDTIYKALKQNKAFNTDMEILRRNLKR